MAKVTDEYVQEQFFARYARMTRWQQEGIITGLRATMLVMAAAPAQSNGDALLLEAEEVPNGQ
jgi:hypothetical protein